MTEPEFVDIDLNPDLDDAHLSDADAPRNLVPEPNLRPEGIVYPPTSGSTGSNVTMSFDSAYHLLRQELGPAVAAVTSPQQSKLVNYIDEQLLHVQRSFIKSQAGDSVQYLLLQLLFDLTRVIDILHVSINRCNGRLYGQDEYLIKIMGDLEDYIAHYKAPFTVLLSVPIFSSQDMQLMTQFFTFFQKLDLHLSLLIDGLGDNGDKLRTTQFVRLLPVTNRLRVLIVERIDPIRAQLVAIMDKDEDPHSPAARQLLNLIDSEVGRLFEGILDRESLR